MNPWFAYVLGILTVVTVVAGSLFAAEWQEHRRQMQAHGLRARIEWLEDEIERLKAEGEEP